MNRISALMLALGLAAAASVWFAADPVEPDPLRSDPLGQKRYRRQLRLIGGQANQLSADFIEWFGERWEGRNLAGTIVVLTVVSVSVFRFVAVRSGRE